MDKNQDEKKVKFSEKISLNFRRKWLVDGTKTILIVAVLFAAYIALNLWIEQIDLPEIDVTENKIYTLSDTSKNVIKNIEQEVKIYVYGFDEKSTLIDLLKQYNKTNEKISYEILTEETNYEMVQKYDLQEGYYILIIQSGDSEKVIDASSDFTTYDYTTYQSVDTTEQTITNSILALNEENKPKVYFVQGHGEYDSSLIGLLTTYLQNEAFEVEFLNLVTAGSVPDDCDILAIMSPSTDFYDSEVSAVKDYINKGGEIYFSMDVVSQTVEFPNIQSILDEYGVSIENGYILEYADGMSMSNYPYIFMPEVSSTHEITRDIYSDSVIWLVYSAKLQFQADEVLENLNVDKEILLNSSDDSAFINDLSTDMATAAQSAELGSFDIAAILTKTISNAENTVEESTDTVESEDIIENEEVVENEDGNESEAITEDVSETDTTAVEETEENTDTQSKLIIVASASFISDYQVSALSQSYPLSYIGSNKDFVINSMAYLGDKGNTLTIRKDYASSTYTPTESQNKVVISIISLVPILIIIIGIVVWANRKRRK